MAKKKKSAGAGTGAGTGAGIEAGIEAGDQPAPPGSLPLPTPQAPQKKNNGTSGSKVAAAAVAAAAAAATSGEGMPLIICRNKHWRYISSFHGPWLHLPLEALESLAHSNYNSPRPRPIDVGVFFDLVKIRRLVGEATPLTVNAANGFGPGSNLKLSHERKHRMRDQATRRLSQAYRVDEIATSVAIMQGTTSLENVAELVLDKKPDDVDAAYVHFFHEKIPSRHVVESTPFGPIDDIVDARPMEPGYLRTRAVLRVFGEDFDGAVADLTAAVQLVRYHRSGAHNDDRDAGVPAPAPTPGRRTPDVKLTEAEQPTSLEMQLMFQRGAAYLSRACQCVYAALPPSDKPDKDARVSEWRADARGPLAAAAATAEDGNGGTNGPIPATEEEAKAQQMAARKLVKTIAKRALRDYMSFLNHVEYSPDCPMDDFDDQSRRNGGEGWRGTMGHGSINDTPQNRTYRLPQLFEPTPPADLPPYPSKPQPPPASSASDPAPLFTQPQETQLQLLPKSPQPPQPTTSPPPLEYVTYHPLLSDALHGVLLCHALLQTNSKELQRHAHMVARLARLADGYPVFQASRSPARADWVEVLRRVGGAEWLALGPGVWDALCRLPSLPQHDGGADRQQQHPPEQGHDDPREYPIWTERAAAIVRWVREAPGLAPLPAASGAAKKKKKKKPSVGVVGAHAGLHHPSHHPQEQQDLESRPCPPGEGGG